MKIIKLGKINNNAIDGDKHFNCPFCGCEYIASSNEYSYETHILDFYTKCPNCKADNWYNPRKDD